MSFSLLPDNRSNSHVGGNGSEGIETGELDHEAISTSKERKLRDESGRIESDGIGAISTKDGKKKSKTDLSGYQKWYYENGGKEKIRDKHALKQIAQKKQTEKYTTQLEKTAYSLQKSKEKYKMMKDKKSKWKVRFIQLKTQNKKYNQEKKKRRMLKDQIREQEKQERLKNQIQSHYFPVENKFL